MVSWKNLEKQHPKGQDSEATIFCKVKLRSFLDHSKLHQKAKCLFRKKQNSEIPKSRKSIFS